MNILVACEESQRVCIELRKKGHVAYSCDLLNCSGGFPKWHIKGDVTKIINGHCIFKTEDGHTHSFMSFKEWDMIIAFPPCTHLAVSGAAWFKEKREDGRQEQAIELFNRILNADCEKIAVENPVNIIGGDYVKEWFPKYADMPKYTQAIHPYYFGDPVRKKTCLWLKNLPELIPTNMVDPEIKKSNSEKGTTYSGPAWSVYDERGKCLRWSDPETAKIRSKTYQGVAKAMAEQWG